MKCHFFSDGSSDVSQNSEENAAFLVLIGFLNKRSFEIKCEKAVCLLFHQNYNNASN